MGHLCGVPRRPCQLPHNTDPCWGSLGFFSTSSTVHPPGISPPAAGRWSPFMGEWPPWWGYWQDISSLVPFHGKLTRRHQWCLRAAPCRPLSLPCRIFPVLFFLLRWAQCLSRCPLSSSAGASLPSFVGKEEEPKEGTEVSAQTLPFPSPMMAACTAAPRGTGWSPPSITGVGGDGTRATHVASLVTPGWSHVGEWGVPAPMFPDFSDSVVKFQGNRTGHTQLLTFKQT